MKLTEEQRSLYWLSACEISASHVQKLLDEYGSAAGVWDAFGSENGPHFHGGAEEKLSKLHSVSAIDEMIQLAESKKIHMLFQEDEAYPEPLRYIQDPPYLLYYAGNLKALEKPMVAIVGTRKASRYGEEMSALIAKELCEAGVTVVSGLARGIDAAAHRAVLAAKGSTIGVLGSGINVPYPPEHVQMLRDIALSSGLILSEFAIDSQPVTFHFPHRNRIISGLSLATVFVEGKIRSGGMLTVTSALNQGREVFAVPGRVGMEGSEGPHTILREGARIVTSGKDILEDLGLLEIAAPETVKKKQFSGNGTQNRILQELRREPLTAQELIDRLNGSADEILSELSTMEILGILIREAGNRFSLPLND